MNNIPYVIVKDLQEAQTTLSDQPVILVLIRGTGNRYMRYCGEFHKIDVSSDLSAYVRSSDQWWSIAGVCFNNDSITWMLNNSIAYPFTREDLVLYQLTWDIVHG